MRGHAYGHAEPEPLQETLPGHYYVPVAGFSEVLNQTEIGLHPRLFCHGVIPYQSVFVRLDPWRGASRPLVYQGPYVVVPLLPPEGKEAKPDSPRLLAHALSYMGAVLPEHNRPLSRAKPEDHVVINTLVNEARRSMARIVREVLRSRSS